MSQQVGSTVRRFRRRAGLTQQQAADLAGLSVAGLRDLEQGRVATPRSATLRRLAEALRLSVSDTEELMRSGRPEQAPAGDLWVQVLGPLAVHVHGASVPVGSARQRLLLGLLGLAPHTLWSQDALIEALWEEQPPANAAELLRVHASRLRRRLPDPRAMVASQGGYQLQASDNQLDLLMFRRLVERARQARTRREPERECQLFAEAVALWRDDPLADLPRLRDHPAVLALRPEWQRAVVEYAETATMLGRHQEVLPLLRRLVAADPLHEVAHARLMTALAAAGQVAAARQAFDTLCRRLAEDLGADPSPALVEAYQAVRRMDGARQGTGAADGDLGGDRVRPGVTPVSAYRQLPPDLPDFTGRTAELEALHGWLAPAAEGSGTAVTIAAIEGMSGVGKTRLAVQLAHRLLAAGRYADVQLYVDLRAHADAPPADPAVVLASFLLLLGVPGDRIPEDQAGRAALFRDRLFGKQALLLLDNADSDRQVLPLLPASPTALVLVTSRRSLALDGARVLPLDVFPYPEAEGLLATVAGPERVAADPAAARRVVELCGRLPLAVSLTARRLRARPGWLLCELADRLERAGDRLGELASGTRQLRAAFDLSYRALDRSEQRLFRLLGLHPHEEFTVESAAALAGSAPGAVRRLLDRLADEHLVTVVAGDRYRLHDLLRDYAGQLVREGETEPERRAALTRVLDYYLHTAARATDRLLPQRVQVALTGAPPPAGPAFPDRPAATRWLDEERPGLLAAVELAAGQGWPAHAWQLAHELRVYQGMYGHSQDRVALHELALRAAQQAGDRTGEVAIRTSMGGAYLDLGRHREAYEQLERALALYRDGLSDADIALELTILGMLGSVCVDLARFPEALLYNQQAVDLSAGQDPYREAVARSNIGSALLLLDRVPQARECYVRALVLARRAREPDSESLVLSNLGKTYQRLGQVRKAFAMLRRALALADHHGLRPRQVNALQHLGNTYRAVGRWDEALRHLHEALALLQAGARRRRKEAEVLLDLGAAYREQGDLDRAAELVQRGLTVAAETGSPYQQARAIDQLAAGCEAAGDATSAAAHRRRARELFAELGVPVPSTGVTPPVAGERAVPAATPRRE